MSNIFVTGGAGFIGCHLVKLLIKKTSYSVINIDKLTYAGNLDSLNSILDNPRHIHENIDICDEISLNKAFHKYKPLAVMHLAAESHVDRSISSPAQFIKTNILGTFNLLHQSRLHYENLTSHDANLFKFHHISTDEVFGDLVDNDTFFTETSSYDPSSPYSASKASSDHLVRAWGRTYGLPILITNCSNNYGPYQFPEKLIPHVIINALKGLPIPIYGDGTQIRDWLYVEDHAEALINVLQKAKIGKTYNIGGNNEKTNLQVVNKICEILESTNLNKSNEVKKYSDLIKFVDDRPGHDCRYAIDATKIKNDLGWTPKETFESGLKKTVEWYLQNDLWLERVLSGDYSLVK